MKRELLRQTSRRPLSSLPEHGTESPKRILCKIRCCRIELQERGTGVQQLARIGRLHIAEEIVSLGKAKNAQQAFKRYLGKSGRAYAAANWQPLSKVLEAIARSHGSSVLAHPLKYQLTRSKMKRLIADFAALGGDAIEVISGKQVQTQTQMLANACLDHGLKGSLGSDFHAPNRPWAELGVAGYLPKACDPIWDSWSL